MFIYLKASTSQLSKIKTYGYKVKIFYFNMIHIELAQQNDIQTSNTEVYTNKKTNHYERINFSTRDILKTGGETGTRTQGTETGSQISNLLHYRSATSPLESLLLTKIFTQVNIFS